MKAERIIALIGYVMSGVMGLILSVVCAAMALSETSITASRAFWFLSLVETGVVVFVAVQITKAIKEWF